MNRKPWTNADGVPNTAMMNSPDAPARAGCNAMNMHGGAGAAIVTGAVNDGGGNNAATAAN